MNKLIIPFLLVCTCLVSGCIKDDEPKDVTQEICMSVSSETGVMYPPFYEEGVECMLVMSEDNPGVWEHLGFNEIKGFTYERGHEYYLRVLSTILANPPMDASNRTYSLKDIIEDRLVAEPEVPIDSDIQSEEDIEYQELCPFEKYDIYHGGYAIDSNGNIYSAEGSPLPFYDATRIYLANILHQADPNWVKFQRTSYQATYSYVLSPLTDKIRLVRNESSGPMFKNIIPENEFAHIIQTMKSGEELKYILILANVYKKGLQKLEFNIKKL